MKLEQPACINMQVVTGWGLFLLCALDQPSDSGDLMGICEVLGTASVEEGELGGQLSVRTQLSPAAVAFAITTLLLITVVFHGLILNHI